MLFTNKVVNLVYLVLWLHYISTGLFFPLKSQVQIAIYSTGIETHLIQAAVEEERKHEVKNCEEEEK